MPSSGDSQHQQTQPMQTVQHSSSQSKSSSSMMMSVSDQAVLDYLKSKGMSSAMLELQERLKEEKKTEKESNIPEGSTDQQQEMVKMEHLYA